MGAKRDDVLRAAVAVFGRVGFADASIDQIATEADVSTRTIYNHFANKDALFDAALVTSAGRVAESREAIIARHLSDPADPVRALVAVATAWLTPDPAFADHFALVHRLRTEAERVDPATRRAWHAAGPQRARRALADALARLPGVRTPDPMRAAGHFLALIAADADETTPRKAARTGVDAFLNGYADRR